MHVIEFHGKRKHSLISQDSTSHSQQLDVIIDSSSKAPLHQAYHHIVTKINTATEKLDDTRHIKIVNKTILVSLNTLINYHKYIL